MFSKHRDRVWGAVVGAVLCALFVFSAAPALACTVSSQGDHVTVSRSADDTLPLSAIRVYSGYAGTDPFDAETPADRIQSYSSYQEFIPVLGVSSFECTVTPGIHLVEVESNGTLSEHVVCAAPISGQLAAPVAVSSMPATLTVSGADGVLPVDVWGSFDYLPGLLAASLLCALFMTGGVLVFGVRRGRV